MLGSTKLRTFLPGGKDYALSKRFYMALGFELIFDLDDVACLGIGGGEFLLQNYYQQGWAENFMMQLVVEDLDAWWAHIDALDLPGQFGVRAPTAPKQMPWGLRTVHIVGPSGELWHIVQG